MLTLEYLKEKAEQLQKVTGCLLCIAGGAPRDILNDKPVKDIDVFIACNESYDVEEALTLLKEELGISCEKISGSSEASDSENPVYETEWEGHKWQFIFKENEFNTLETFTNSLIADFDYGFCQVAIKPYQKEPYTCTEQYAIDIVNKCINRNPEIPITEYKTDKAEERLKRLQKKYPEFKVEPLPELNQILRREEELLHRIWEEQDRMRREEPRRVRIDVHEERPLAGNQPQWVIVDDIVEAPRHNANMQWWNDMIQHAPRRDR